MQSFSSLVALALMFGAEPVSQPLAVLPNGDDAGRRLAAEQEAPFPERLHEFGGGAMQGEVWRGLTEAYRPLPQSQVRIERRVIIRIAPRRPVENGDMLASLPQNGLPPRFKEKGMAKCVPIREIGGAQVQGSNRLMLFMRDRQLVSVTLEKGCSARDFYSGFYVERGDDGLICSGRDVLQSRSGTKCELRKLHRLVPVRD
ncbi:MAG: hypothetical protein WCY92_01295 [Novosphingobium sp.]